MTDETNKHTPPPSTHVRGDDWFSKVISFFVQHDMLDVRDEYHISDVIGALHDNYAPALIKAVEGIDDDYMTSENHHPGYVLIPTAKFEEIRAALKHARGQIQHPDQLIDEAIASADTLATTEGQP